MTHNPPQTDVTAIPETSLLLEALRFSAEKHRDQRRKDRGASPYINHPIAVAHVLATAGGVNDITTLLGAVLHDTLEDTDTTPRELEEKFGREVRVLVQELTDDKALAKANRKRLQIEHAPTASQRAQVIKVADKICNVLDVTFSPPANWSTRRRSEYLDWTDQVVAGCRGCNHALERYYQDVLRQGRAAVKDRIARDS